jgi:Transposase DDE domain
MMMRLCSDNREEVVNAIQSGSIRGASISSPHLIDEMISKMYDMNLISCLDQVLKDKRRVNSSIPLNVLITLCIAAKMKLKNSMTDVPYAITDAGLLSKLGWNMLEIEDANGGLISEGTIRNVLSKYDTDEIIHFYNAYLSEQVFKELGISPDIHILDCTELEVPLENGNYEGAGIVSSKGKETKRGYKLATLRGITDDSGFIEEIRLGPINTHDLELSRHILMNSKNIKEGDIVIQDKGFLSREIINHLKTVKSVDVFMPVKSHMVIYEQAVQIAKTEGKWQNHPNKKRTTQKIQLVSDLGDFYKDPDGSIDDVPLNACVVKDDRNPEKEQFYVFITTDTSKSAKMIIRTYELRPEIEEDYRQMKDFWTLSEFQSTKFHFVAFHIVMVLLGYLFFQIYKTTHEGKHFKKKSLPVMLKNYVSSKTKDVIVYTRKHFGIFSFLEFMELYSNCDEKTRMKLRPALSSV